MLNMITIKQLNFEIVTSTSTQCIQFTVPTTRTLLVIYECSTRSSYMFRYKRSIFREHNMSRLKPISSDNLLFTVSTVCSRLRC
jgi:hypothetical protein